jgi:hypothetical protein
MKPGALKGFIGTLATEKMTAVGEGVRGVRGIGGGRPAQRAVSSTAEGGATWD